MGRRVLRLHIWGYTVCLCPIKGTPGLNELTLVFSPIPKTGEAQDEPTGLRGKMLYHIKQKLLPFVYILWFNVPSIILQSCQDTAIQYLSRPMGKPTICICENKGADQLRGNREADQRLCFRYSESTIPPLLNSKISSF